ncbi:MAG: YraN family protein [Sulfurovum sp.]|jgi:putative endonuclease|nr:MAG: YraN family protein [Sulfurovum sp.]
MSSRDKGNFSESRACSYLEDRDFIIIERNYYAKKLGEIDIIASKDGILHFVEVKSALADFDPIYNLTKGKLKKVINSAFYFMKERKLHMAFSIDAMIIRDEEIEFIENITM